MLFALDWKAIIYMATVLQETKEFRPQLPARFGGFESLGITYQDEAVARTRYKNVQTFGRVHEPNRAIRV